MTDSTPRDPNTAPDNDTAPDYDTTPHPGTETATTALGDGWVEKDGDVLPEEVEEILPEAHPTEGQQPLP